MGVGRDTEVEEEAREEEEEEEGSRTIEGAEDDATR
jgi:hypothetical protein